MKLSSPPKKEIYNSFLYMTYLECYAGGAAKREGKILGTWKTVSHSVKATVKL